MTIAGRPGITGGRRGGAAADIVCVLDAAGSMPMTVIRIAPRGVALWRGTASFVTALRCRLGSRFCSLPLFVLLAEGSTMNLRMFSNKWMSLRKRVSTEDHRGCQPEGGQASSLSLRQVEGMYTQKREKKKPKSKTANNPLLNDGIVLHR